MHLVLQTPYRTIKYAKGMEANTEVISTCERLDHNSHLTQDYRGISHYFYCAMSDREQKRKEVLLVGIEPLTWQTWKVVVSAVRICPIVLQISIIQPHRH